MTRVFEELAVVFDSGGYVAADRAELFGSGEDAQAAGETFCRNLIIRTRRSEPLLSGGIRQSVVKRR